MMAEVNFFQRALHALVEGRARQAERYIARLDAETHAARNRVKRR